MSASRASEALRSSSARLVARHFFHGLADALFVAVAFVGAGVPVPAKEGPNWRKGLRLVNLGFYPF